MGAEDSKSREGLKISPIARPTDTVVISPRSGKGLSKLCLQCTDNRLCPGCICARGSGGGGETYLCRDCGPETCLVKEARYIVYSSSAEALAFYLRHREVVQIEFVKGQSSTSRREEWRSGEKEEEKKMGIIEKAFSTENGEPFLEKKTEIDFREIVRKDMKRDGDYCRLRDEFTAEASGKYSNMDLQRRIRECTQKEILDILKAVPERSFVFLAKHKYGTYVVQLMLKLAKDEELHEEIKRLIFPHAVSLLKHEIGNYVVQHVIDFDREFVLACFLADLEDVLASRTGARAMKNCVKHFMAHKDELVPRIEKARRFLKSQDSLKITRSILRDLEEQ